MTAISGQSTIALVTTSGALNAKELQRYLSRISGRWPIDVALLGGARVDDLRGAAPQRERGPEYVLVLVSPAFDGMPWLERVYQASSLWDAHEMGDPADIHCYTPPEFARKRLSMPAVRRVFERGMLLYEDRFAADDASDPTDGTASGLSV